MFAGVLKTRETQWKRHVVSEDIVNLLRKYQPHNELHGQAADEIERLRKIIVEYHAAEIGYEESLEDDDSTLEPEWLRAWDALEKEGNKILKLSSKSRSRHGKL